MGRCVAAPGPGVGCEGAEDVVSQLPARGSWHFIAAENSMGFHNPGEALRILASATDLARQAQVKAVLAVSPK